MVDPALSSGEYPGTHICQIHIDNLRILQVRIHGHSGLKCLQQPWNPRLEELPHIPQGGNQWLHHKQQPMGDIYT